MTAEREARLPRRTPGVISREVGDEFVVIHPETGTAHALAGLHAAVWRSTGDEGEPLAPVPPADLDAVLLELADLGLLRTDGLDRRTVLRRGAKAGGLVAAAGVTSLVLPAASAAASTALAPVSQLTAGNYSFRPAVNVVRIDFVIVGGGGSGRLYASGGGGASVSGSIRATAGGTLGRPFINGIIGAGATRNPPALSTNSGGVGAGNGQGNANVGGGGGGTSLRIGNTDPGGILGGVLNPAANGDTANVLAALAGGGGGAGFSPSLDSGDGGGGGQAGTAATDFASGNGGGGGSAGTQTAGTSGTGAAGAAGGGVAGTAGAAATANSGNGGANGAAPSANGTTTRGGGGGGGYGGGGSGGAGTSSGGGGGGGGNYTGGATGYQITFNAPGVFANGGGVGGTSALNDAQPGRVTLTFFTNP